MLCSFTQTYSDNRSELFYFHNKDKTDIYFRNKLDKNYFVFHNSPNEYKEKIIQNSYFNDIKNIDILSYDNICYTDSFYSTLMRIKNDGYKYVFFLQDDVFSNVNEKLIDELLIFINNNSFEMLNIERTNIKTEAPTIFSHDNLKIFDTNSEDFKNNNLWAFDDGPYVANIDFLINTVYDNYYFSMKDIWTGEVYLNDKISRSKIQRLSTNFQFFERYSIVGRNIAYDYYIDKLNRLFL
jgi:hypothetical protein